MPTPRYWMASTHPQPYRLADRTYRAIDSNYWAIGGGPPWYCRCRRCGIDTEPQAGKPRKCRDCYELEQCARKDALLDRVAELAEDGMSQRQIAATLGVSKGTIANWLADARRDVVAV